MSSEEARRTVQAGLDRRKVARAEREDRLEQYEKDMISACNGRCADAKILRLADEAGRASKEQAQARRMARMEAQVKERERENKATDAVKRYLLCCLALLILTAFTHLPLWAAIATAISTAVFPAGYVFRLYFPAEIPQEVAR